MLLINLNISKRITIFPLVTIKMDTGAARYFEEQTKDPEYREHYEKMRARIARSDELASKIEAVPKRFDKLARDV